MRRWLVVLLTMGMSAGLLQAGSRADVPHPEPAFIQQVPAQPCSAGTSNAYEAPATHLTDYGELGVCKRLRFAFGPITVRPGQNDVLVQPATIEKPAYDGYIVRFRPDLVDATGTAPAIDEVHLHHGTWLNGNGNYGNSNIFFASGEEKTIAIWPRGYGMQVKANDVWLLLYMVHNTSALTREVWITYDIDFVSAKGNDEVLKPRGQGIVPTRPVWLDVGSGKFHPDALSNGGNPVFNVQRGFGSFDADAGRRVCRFPAQNCATFNWLGTVTAQQGKPVEGVLGKDWVVDSKMAGTLIMMGGHLHPGGIRDDVSLVRGGVEKPIHISDAVYWQRGQNNHLAGGPPTSWDFSMTGTTRDLGWAVKIKEGDRVRLNAVYDSQDSSWYENMGIVMAWVAPAGYDAGGVDVFDDDVTLDPGIPDTATTTPGFRPATCTPDLAAATKTLCLRGQVTHGHMAEASNFGGCPPAGCTPLTSLDGPMLTDIPVAAFEYGPASAGVFSVQGVPRVRVNKPVRFWNLDAFAGIWHTMTRCAEPCKGRTGLDYPLANGGTGLPPDPMDFDSTEIGYGLPISPASGNIGGDKPFDRQIRDGFLWEFTPTRTGTFSFFCRIHPQMRGAIRVVE